MQNGFMFTRNGLLDKCSFLVGVSEANTLLAKAPEPGLAHG